MVQIIKSKFLLIFTNLLLDAVIQMISSLVAHLILKVEYTIDHKPFMHFLILQFISEFFQALFYPFHLFLASHVFSFFIIGILCGNYLSLAFSVLLIKFFHFGYQMS